MSRHMKLLAAVAGVSLLALTIAGNLPAKGPKPKTAMYTIQGHVCSGVGDYDSNNQWNCVVDPENEDHFKEIGVNVTGWWPPDGTLELRVSGDVLCEGKHPELCIPIPELPGGTYQGRARLLDHRFDFEFDVPGRTPCKFVGWDTPFPLDPETTEYCRYGLIFGFERWDVDGSVGFLEFRFVDFTKGDQLTDPQIYRGSGFVPEWWDGSDLRTFQLLFPADEPGSSETTGESGKKRCTNGIDDDSDGYTDCNDSECSGSTFCK